MIPKIIHYCWVGNDPKPDSVLYCIESWKKYCPDYEIREWNESNYDFTKNLYMKQAYEAKKWGFVPDYARLDIVYKYGGIYLDTDVEIIRSFDELLDQDGFFGFEDTGEETYFVACGLGFGASKHNPLIKKLRDYYEEVTFVNPDGSLNLLPAPQHNTQIFAEYGILMNNSIQRIQNNTFYSAEYFCPKIFKTGKMKITSNTFSIHHFSASWMDDEIRKNIVHNQEVCLCFGDKIGKKILLIESVWKKYGFWGGLKKSLIRLYEAIYLYWPIVIGMIKKTECMTISEKEIVLFDTGLGTQNLGDLIIMENCRKYLSDIFDLSGSIHISTHNIPTDEELHNIQKKRKIICGTNALSCQMGRYGLWKLPRKVEKYCNTILMGVGFDSYNTKSDLYTRLLLKLILSCKGIHSVRDSFSESTLKSMGITNVLNTGCPTMWGLTSEFCALIPTQKATKVVCTLTDYCKDVINDSAMLDILLKNYKKVYIWLQGQGDLEYIRQLGYDNRMVLIPSDLKEYDTVLEQSDLDYVGTRLHAGIRALNKGHRSLIVSIDNRAECIHKDTGLPIIQRKDISIELNNMIHDKIETQIHMPWGNIMLWMEQFKK